MASMVKLKPSNQSLAARGLPVSNPVVKKKQKVPTTRKKKITTTNARNVNSDDSDKRHSCENGLDRCASLLAAMLEPTQCGKIKKPLKKIVPHNKRSSTPIDNDNVGMNKLGKLPTAVSHRIDSSQASDTNTIDELIEEKTLLQQYLNKIVHRSSEIEKQVAAASKGKCDLLDIDQNADVTRDHGSSVISRQKVSDGNQCSKSTNAFVNVRNNGDDKIESLQHSVVNGDENDVTLTNENCKLGGNVSENNAGEAEKNESDKSELFEILESITSKLKVSPDNHSTGIEEDSYMQKVSSNHVNTLNDLSKDNNCSQKDNTQNSSSHGSVDKTKNKNKPNTSTEVEVMPDLRTDNSEHYCYESMHENEGSVDSIRHAIFKAYRDNLPSFLQVTLGKSSEEAHSSINSQCVGNQPPVLSSDNHPSSSSCLLDQQHNPMRVSHPTLTRDNFDVINHGLSHTGSHPDQTRTHLSTLDFLVKELRTKTMKQWNIEVDQLFTEVEHVIGSLSFLCNVTSHDVPVGIGKSLDPIYIENADLRKKSQILSEQVEDLNDTINKLRLNDPGNVKSEEASVDLIIKTVQEKLGSEQHLKHAMNAELTNLRKTNNELKKENCSLLQSVSEKDLRVLEEREKYVKEHSSKDKEIGVLRAQIEELETHRQTVEKEKNIINLSVRQKDYEIDRLSKLNVDLQESVSKLLIYISDVKKKPDWQQQYNCMMQTKCPPGNHFPSDKLNLQTDHVNGLSDLLLARETTLIETGSSLNSDPICVDDMESECESDMLSIVNNVSAPSLRSKMSTLSETDFSLWSLATYDGNEFQRNVEHLDAEIKRIQSSIKNMNKTK